MPFEAPLRIPRELDRRPHPDPDPRGRGADPPRPPRRGSGPSAAPSRARPSAAAPASAPGSPSRTSCPTRRGSSRSTCTAATTRSRFDGQPGGLTKRQPISYFCRIPFGLSARESGNDLLIPPGGRKTYVYELREDGRPERAAFQWYHDHRLDRTAPHAWRGLAGMWIVDDDFEDSLPLPRGERDIPLMIADRSFDRHNQLTDPFEGGLQPPADGIAGAGDPRQRRLHAPSPGRAPAATGCASSTSPSSAPTTCSSPTAPRWSRSAATAA